MAQIVMLIDDHPLLRSAIRSLLESLSEEVQVRVAGSLAEAFKRLSSEGLPDLAILDLGLPDACGTATITAFSRRAPGIPIIAMTGYIDERTAAGIRAAGASEMISKARTADEWREAIKRVLNSLAALGLDGKSVYADRISSTPTEPATRSGLDHSSAMRPAPPGLKDGRHLGLTPRQREVLGLILQGLSNKAISRETGMAAGTVKIHVGSVLRSLRVSSRSQAIIAALKAGIDLKRPV